MNLLTRTSIILVALCTFPAYASSIQAPPEILEGIRLAEYNFSAQGGGFSAPNRAHGFRSHLTTEGLVLNDRVRGDAAWRIDMHPCRFGREGSLQPVEGGTVRAIGAKVEHARPGLVEWYVSSPSGLEQGFEIDRPPAGDRTRPLVLELILGGTLRPRMEGQAVVLETPNGTQALRYDGLLVRDAGGQTIPADLALVGRTVQIRVHDEAAVYPLTIDPLFTSPSFTIIGPGPGAQIGFSVASANVNGDAYADLIVGAPWFDGGQSDEGRVFVYLGDSTGLMTTPDWTAEGVEEDMELGFSVANAGRVNDDAYDDIIVGAPRTTAYPALDGKAFVWHGGAAGLGDDGDPNNADWVAVSGKPGSHFGFAVAGAADVNGDSRDDVIVGAPKYEDPASHVDEGWVFVWHGSDQGLPQNGNPSNAAWSAQSKTQQGHPIGANMGFSVAFGNLDGDGFDDAIVGAPYFTGNQTSQGHAFVWVGSADGLNDGSPGQPNNSDWRAKSDESYASFGSSVMAADVDGDEFDDVVIGAPEHGNGGSVFLWQGRTDFGRHGQDNGDPDNADWRADSTVSGAKFGTSIGAADVLDSGAKSLIVGAPSYSAGAAFVWYACPTSGLGPDSNTAAADWSYFHPGPAARLGQAVAGIGDLDGDGLPEFAVGAPTHNSEAGEVLVFEGNGDTPSVQVLAPNGGESLVIGSQVTLQWNAASVCSPVQTVDIQLSRTGPNGPFDLQFDNITNNGSIPWIVFGPESTNAFIRILAPGPGGTIGQDLSDNAFTIRSDTSCGPCPQPYCQSVGYRCTFNGSCGAEGCCNFTCGPDITCEQEDQIPPGVC